MSGYKWQLSIAILNGFPVALKLNLGVPYMELEWFLDGTVMELEWNCYGTVMELG